MEKTAGFPPKFVAIPRTYSSRRFGARVYRVHGKNQVERTWRPWNGQKCGDPGGPGGLVLGRLVASWTKQNWSINRFIFILVVRRTGGGDFCRRLISEPRVMGKAAIRGGGNQRQISTLTKRSGVLVLLRPVGQLQDWPGGGRRGGVASCRAVTRCSRARSSKQGRGKAGFAQPARKALVDFPAVS